VGCNSTRHPLLTGVKYFRDFDEQRGYTTASRYIVAGPTGKAYPPAQGT